MLRIVCRSGTCLIAFSSCCVTVIIIFFIGFCLASVIIFIFGKVISGNKDVCILLYTNPPPSKMITMTTVIGFLYVVKKLRMECLKFFALCFGWCILFF